MHELLTACGLFNRPNWAGSPGLGLLAQLLAHMCQAHTMAASRAQIVCICHGMKSEALKFESVSMGQISNSIYFFSTFHMVSQSLSNLQV